MTRAQTRPSVMERDREGLRGTLSVSVGSGAPERHHVRCYPIYIAGGFISKATRPT